MIKRPFEQWLFEDVEIEFDIVRIKNMPELFQWLDIQDLPNDIPILENLREELVDNVETWNEDELKMLFIAPFLKYFKFNYPPYYRVYTQRHRTLKTATVEASGRVEWMVCTGKQRPRQPFFFLQEYKPEKGTNNDPLGQLLIAMVDAQLRNTSSEVPLYGCYTIGRMWFFVLLIDKTYGVSRAYDATQEDDFYAIRLILKRVVAYIQEVLGLEKQ